MLLSKLIADLRLDLSDPGATLFTDPSLGRCIQKAAFRLGREVGVVLTVTSSEITPTPSDDLRELLMVLSQVYACQVMRSATANAFSFSSGDKRVDKSGQPVQWAKLEADLLEEYAHRITEWRRGKQPDYEPYILTPTNLCPVLYEQGIDLDVIE